MQRWQYCNTRQEIRNNTGRNLPPQASSETLHRKPFFKMQFSAIQWNAVAKNALCFLLGYKKTKEAPNSHMHFHFADPDDDDDHHHHQSATKASGNAKTDLTRVTIIIHSSPHYHGILSIHSSSPGVHIQAGARVTLLQNRTHRLHGQRSLLFNGTEVLSRE